MRIDRLAVVGVSRGGEPAVLLGATFPALTAVVGSVPGGVAHASIGVAGAPSWTHRGEPVPYLFPPDAAAKDIHYCANNRPALGREGFDVLGHFSHCFNGRTTSPSTSPT